MPNSDDDDDILIYENNVCPNAVTQPLWHPAVDDCVVYVIIVMSLCTEELPELINGSSIC